MWHENLDWNFIPTLSWRFILAWNRWYLILVDTFGRKFSRTKAWLYRVYNAYKPFFLLSSLFSWFHVIGGCDETNPSEIIFILSFSENPMGIHRRRHKKSIGNAQDYQDGGQRGFIGTISHMHGGTQEIYMGPKKKSTGKLCRKSIRNP